MLDIFFFLTPFKYSSIYFSDSLKKWTDERKRCIWFKVHISDAYWVPLLANVNILNLLGT